MTARPRQPYRTANANAFAEWLTREKDRRGLTDRAFAAAIGVVKTTFHSWRHGQRLPQMEHLLALADYTGTDLAHLRSLIGLPAQPDTPPPPVLWLPLVVSFAPGAVPEPAIPYLPDRPAPSADAFLAARLVDSPVHHILPGDIAIVDRHLPPAVDSWLLVADGDRPALRRAQRRDRAWFVADLHGQAAVPLVDGLWRGVAVEVRRALHHA